MILSKEDFGPKSNPDIKTLKYMLLMHEDPRFFVMMLCDCEDAKKWNKTGQKLVAKTMFLRRTWKVPTQILPKNASAYCQTQKCIPSLKTKSFWFTQTTMS